MESIEKWGEYLVAERRFSPLTVRAYTDDLRAFAEYFVGGEVEVCGYEPVDGETSVSGLQKDSLKAFDPANVAFSDLRSYIMFLVERGDNPKSTNRHISALKSYFKYMVRSGVIEKNPTLKIHTLPQQSLLPEFISKKSGEDIVRHLMNDSDDWLQRRNAIMVLLLFTTGIRRSELATLEVANVDFEQKKIRVTGKGAKEREIPLLPQISDILEQFLTENSEKNICIRGQKFVFLTNKCKPITTGEVYKVVREVLKEAGVQGKQSPHILRHTFATHLMEGGASLRSIQELLGHASLSSTEIYTHNTIDRLKESYKNAHPRAKSL